MWMGVDLGTQSVRAVLVDDDGAMLGSGAAPLGGGRDGVRHEQSPDEWWEAVRTAIGGALRDRPPGPVGALAVCGTSGTVLLTDGEGRPLTPGLMYDDGRATAEAALARERGLRVQPTWALPKAMWLLSRHPASAGVRLTHQPDHIVSRLVGRRTPTDSSHALKTGYDLTADAWPHEKLAGLGLAEELFPDVVRPGARLGEVGADGEAATGVPAGTPVIAGMTDGCAAQIASGSLSLGSWNSVLGTTLVLKGVTAEPVHDSTGVVYNHRAPDGGWLPGGASGVGAGALARAFPDADPARLDGLAPAHEPSTALAYPLVSRGERFPFLAPEATPFLLGDPGSAADHWAALLQGVGHTERLCLDYLDHLGAPQDGPLTFTGGGSRSAYWNQLRTDILGRTVHIPRHSEPALGMAVLAAYGAGAAPTLADAAKRMVGLSHVLSPDPARTARFLEPYLKVVGELERRGWLPSPVATHARTRADSLETS
ncbi:carbohydrate kinase [Streptomyces camponoticapitis]|uniref:Carbohydrate kinase n=2 Tax=Streptomyces camponoticapitis TaxID=1616125 RepID=A0ABQ2E326_9ACTN|nr:FGGY family carbohydrate kinase [Streptomyces camponoticapitis]GGJ89692.1 carbohydrate kinase [Streptomyces camponoticapitis]